MVKLFLNKEQIVIRQEMKKHNSVLLTLSLMAFFALGIATQSQAQTSRLAIKKPTSGTGVTLDNESGGNTLFSISGSEKMRLTSTSGLSIGTTSSLENASLTLKDSNGGGWKHLALQGNSENWCMGVFGGGGFYIAKDGFSSAQTKFVLKGDNVGIGTTSPQAKLEISQDSDPNSDHALIISEAGNSQKIRLHLANNPSGQYGYFHLGGNTTLRGNGQPSTFDGNVGIGTTSPSTSLHITNGSGSTWLTLDRATSNEDSGIMLKTANVTDFFIYTKSASVNNSLQVIASGLAGENGDNPRLRLPKGNKDLYFALSGGNVGIGTTSPSYKLEVAGDINASGKVRSNGNELISDARFKKNIQTIDNKAVAKLSQVRGTSYQFRTKEFKNRNFDEGKQLGLIAQELMKVYPELVSKGADGYYSVNYTGLIPVLVEAVKDLRKKNAVLKDNSQAIKAELNTLKSRMAALEKLLIKAKK